MTDLLVKARGGYFRLWPLYVWIVWVVIGRSLSWEIVL